MSKADEIKLDIEELQNLLQTAQRRRSKDLLSVEIRRLQTELSKLMEKSPAPSTEKSTNVTSGMRCYHTKLTNYCWDQNESFVKIYITLNNVHNLPKESVSCTFTKRSMSLTVMELDNRNYELTINNLCEEIDPSKSSTKTKTNMIVVFLAKQSPRTWSHVTGVEKQIKESKAPAMDMEDDKNNPEASLMNLMKKMYQDGDDEMKKTIAKAWTESQEKKVAGLDFPNL